MLERRKREYHAIHPRLNAVTGRIKCQSVSSKPLSPCVFIPPTGRNGSPVSGFLIVT